MTLLVIAGGLLAVVAGVLRSLAADEVRGRMQRHAKAHLETTISSLPPAVQEEWGDDWRAELTSLSAMPLTAMAFTRGIRRTVGQLAAAPALAAVDASAPVGQLPSQGGKRALSPGRYFRYLLSTPKALLSVLRALFSALPPYLGLSGAHTIMLMGGAGLIGLLLSFLGLSTTLSTLGIVGYSAAAAFLMPLRQ